DRALRRSSIAWIRWGGPTESGGARTPPPGRGVQLGTLGDRRRLSSPLIDELARPVHATTVPDDDHPAALGGVPEHPAHLAGRLRRRMHLLHTRLARALPGRLGRRVRLPRPRLALGQDLAAFVLGQPAPDAVADPVLQRV